MPSCLIELPRYQEFKDMFAPMEPLVKTFELDKLPHLHKLLPTLQSNKTFENQGFP